MLERPWTRTAALIGILVFVALVLCAAGFLLYGHNLSTRVAAAEQQVRARGHPVSLDELDEYYPQVPTGNNAALVYEEGFEKLEALDPGGDKTGALVDRLAASSSSLSVPPELQRDIQVHLTNHREVLAILDRAALRSRARYPLDLLKGLEVELPHLAVLRSYARLEVLRGTQGILESKPEVFVRSQKSTLAVAKSLHDEPLLISQLVRIAIEAIGVQALADGLSRAPLPADDLATLEKVYAAAEDPDAMIRAFAGERCLMLDGVQALATRNLQSSDPDTAALNDRALRSAARIGTGQFFIGQQRLAALEHMSPLTNVSGRSWPERLEAARRIKAEMEAQPDRYLVGQSLSDFCRATEVFARQAALVRMARVACAVERFRLASGSLPEDLNQLVPQYLSALPEDPFDGQPLRYKASGRGYRLYSIFADGKDDGGIQAEKNDGGEFIGDWVFQVKR